MKNQMTLVHVRNSPAKLSCTLSPRPLADCKNLRNSARERERENERKAAFVFCACVEMLQQQQHRARIILNCAASFAHLLEYTWARSLAHSSALHFIAANQPSPDRILTMLMMMTRGERAQALRTIDCEANNVDALLSAREGRRAETLAQRATLCVSSLVEYHSFILFCSK